MSVELRVTKGARTGQRASFDQAVIAIGRHPQSDLRFDPESDRDVSARHAEIRKVGTTWVLSDAGSTNGTYVNGGKLKSTHQLRDGDVLSFGTDGPVVEVRLPTAAESRGEAVRPTRVSRDMAHGAPPPPATGKAANTTERVAIAVRQQTAPLRMALGALALLLVVGAAVGVWYTGRQSSDVRQLLSLTDSLTRIIEQQSSAMKGRLGELDSTLAAEKQVTEQLRSQIEGGAAGDMAKNQLATSLRRQQNILAAGQINHEAILAANGKAVAIIFVEMADGRTWSGTGFNVSQAGYLVTNRHLVLDEQGRTPKRIAVVFSDTKDGLPAKVIRTAQGNTDLAILQLTEPGKYPVVNGIATDRRGINAGKAVAIIGYPLGLDLPQSRDGGTSEFTARSTLGAGMLSKTLGDVLQIEAFAGQGSSGSPVFDANGGVVGVVYGGAAESGGRIVFAVPPEKVVAELMAAGVR